MILDFVSIELHIKLHKKSEKYNVIVSALWNHAIPVTINGVQTYTLSICDSLIYLCLHLDKHFRIGKVQFTSFNDITNLLEKFSATIDWTVFSETCQLYKCEVIVFKYIIMIHKYMNPYIPNEIIQHWGLLLNEKEEKLFIKYLKGYVGFIGNFTTHLKTLRSIQNKLDKVNYIWNVLFPLKMFMIERYKIKRPSLVFLYYPYRYYIGISRVVNQIRKKYN